MLFITTTTTTAPGGEIQSQRARDARPRPRQMSKAPSRQVLPNVQVASIQGVPSTKSRTAVPWTHTYNGYQDTPHLHMRGMTHPTRHSPPPIYCAPCVARILHTSPSHTDRSRFYSIAFVLGNRHTMPFARMATRKRACASVASAAHATSCRRPSFVTPFSEAFSARSRWRS